MKTISSIFLFADRSSKRTYFGTYIPIIVLLCFVVFTGFVIITPDYKERLTSWAFSKSMLLMQSDGCKIHCRPAGSAPLPKGIISESSNFEMQHLWSLVDKKVTAKSSKSLLAIAVGVKQKDVVDQIVKKFPLSNFTIMLFHYDGNVDGWRDLQWSDSAIHVSALNQTKWWFAKRFLHPDLISEYGHIFLWDEDLGVEHFDPLRYLSVVKEEGLHISQPALDPTKLVHHQITARGRRARVHRRIYKFKGGGRCFENSTAPPCTGWVEMMAPVFSRAAWQCAWYMIQNDLIHAWGLDFKLGYCAQGDRSKNVGVVDSEYISHLGIPTLGGSIKSKMETKASSVSGSSHSKSSLNISDDPRSAIRLQSSFELDIFNKRWALAVKEDTCWVDPYLSHTNRTNDTLAQ